MDLNRNHVDRTKNGLKSEPEAGSSTQICPDENKLKREIGLFNAVAITIGGIIGSGIFISPKGILSHVGSIGASLIVWVFCGFSAILGALCYAELGTTYPTAGGKYTYILEAFGPVLAFLYLWSNTLIFVPIGNAILGLAFANYVAQPFFQTSADIPQSAVQLFAAVAICLSTFANCCDIGKTKKIWNLFMVLKISALIIIIVGGIYSVTQGNIKNFGSIWDDSKVDPGSLILASFSGSFAFGGWDFLASLMEELKNPNKNFPRAIIISLSFITVIYVSANLSYFTVLTPTEMLSSDAVAVTFIEKLIGFWGWIVPLFVSISIFGTLTIHILSTSRGCYVGSRCGQLPSFISLLTLSNKSPAPAVIFLTLLSLLFLFSADVFELIEFGAITSGFMSLMTAIAVVYLRWKKPNIVRPFKVYSAIPVAYIIMCLVIFIIPIYVKPLTSGIGAIFTLSGLPVYYIFIKDGKPVNVKWIHNLNAKLTSYAQKLFLAVKEDPHL